MGPGEAAVSLPVPLHGDSVFPMSVTSGTLPCQVCLWLSLEVPFQSYPHPAAVGHGFHQSCSCWLSDPGKPSHLFDRHQWWPQGPAC